jgi:hypothetical protein
MMLEYLVQHPDEWDELLEPEEPLPPASEFVEGQCPECKGWRLGKAPSALDENGNWPKSGHHMWCSRWKKHWEYIDFRTLDDGQEVLYRR